MAAFSVFKRRFKSPLNNIQFDVTAPQIENEEGLLQWNATDGTLDLGMSNGTIAMQLGQEMFIKVVNKSGALIENGAAIYISGRQGERPKIELAQGNAMATSRVVGLTTQDIADDAEGFVTTFGYVRQIKTNYAGWTTGAKLYVSSTVAGELTIVEPTAPHHADEVGTIAVVGAKGIGSILVNINRHTDLSSLADVDGTPLATNGQILVWDNDNGYYDPDKNINDYARKDSINTFTEQQTFGDGTNNVTIDKVKGKRYNGTATVWKDMSIDLFGSQLYSTAGKVDYDYVEGCLLFNSGGSLSQVNDIVSGNLQVNHEFKVGTDVVFYPHIHWWQQVTSGAVLPIVFSCQYRLQRNNTGKTTAWTTITADAGTAKDVFDFTSLPDGLYNQLTNFDPITLTLGISDTIQFKIARTDSQTGDVRATYFDVHGATDSDGSDGIVSKTY